MKDRQGECLGKISNPYRVWKVYKHRFSENTELAIGRTLTFCSHEPSLWSAIERDEVFNRPIVEPAEMIARTSDSNRFPYFHWCETKLIATTARERVVFASRCILMERNDVFHVFLTVQACCH